MIAAIGAKEFVESATLRSVVRNAVEAALDAFSDRNLRGDELAVTLADLSDPERLRFGSHRGSAKMYPASVVKLFYLHAAHAWIEQGQLADTLELRGAMRDMIVDSSNDATHFLVDRLTETTSGPELPTDEMSLWIEKRNAVNRYFAAQGFIDINVNQKTWNEKPYGRDHVFVGENLENRNLLTTNATARLLSSIALGRAVSKARSGAMLELMLRDPFSEADSRDEQARAFIGQALPRGARLWSKAGWTSETRHDAACFELPGGERFALVIFTVHHASERRLISTLAGSILSATPEMR